MNEDHDEFEDYEKYYDEPILSWKNYTKYNEISTDENTSTLFIFGISENEVISISRDFTQINDLRMEIDSDNKIGFPITRIFRGDNEVLFFYHFINCLIIRIKKIIREPILYFFKKKQIKVIEITHSINKFQLENTEIKGVSRTGIFGNDEELLPRTFYRFKIGRNLVAKVLLEYLEGEFGFISPTLLMFEVVDGYRGQGIGTRIIHTIECLMKNLGFSNLFLAETESTNFWRKMGYKIDIDEGSKSLKQIKCKNYKTKS